jgi:outer membrane biosynthesis protein TonB
VSDELNSAAKDLVAAARRSGRTLEPGRRARLRYGVVAGVATSSVAAAASVSLGKLVIVGALSAALGSGATLLVVRATASAPGPMTERPSTTPAAPVAKPRPAPSPPVAPLAPTPSAVSPPAEVQPPPRAEPQPEPRPSPRPVEVQQPLAEAPTPPVARAVAAKSSPAAGLAEELELLSRVLAATQAQRWTDAQALLAEHERRFSPAALRSEARAMQVVVWCGSGHVEGARRLARELELEDPLNPAVQRLHATCAW